MEWSIEAMLVKIKMENHVKTGPSQVSFQQLSTTTAETFMSTGIKSGVSLKQEEKQDYKIWNLVMFLSVVRNRRKSSFLRMDLEVMSVRLSL